jgi:serine-type D-Ala-D-Ala carboxypeptidase/endopeptidase (penicillin-binding protein 4)
LKRYVDAGLRAALLAAAVALLVLAPTAPAAAATASGDPATLSPRLARALAVPHVTPRSSAVAIDLQTGRVVFAQRSGLPLAPASTEKLAVSYALLSSLGPKYRIETRVLAEGTVSGATLQGRLVLKGHGDPSLTTARVRRLAAAVRERGIRHVTGGVVGDESFYDTQRTVAGWKPQYYISQSPPLSALVVDRGRYRGATSHRPALAAAASFRSALQAAGVAVAGQASVGRARPGGTVLAQSASQPLAVLLRAVNGDSDNFGSELLLKHLGAVQLRKGTSAAGAVVVRRELEAAGIPVTGIRIVDGSGLSLLDRLTGDALVGILVAAWSDPALRPVFTASLAVSGRSGTLRYRLRGTATWGRVAAKTGTTRQSSALAGYVGGRYAFAVVHNGSPVSTLWARRAQDAFVTVLAGK